LKAGFSPPRQKNRQKKKPETATYNRLVERDNTPAGACGIGFA
jgi:hypothetical protein